MTGVEITRDNIFFGAMRNLTVLIDNQKVGVVKPSSKEFFAVPPGQHTVAVKMDWVASAPFEVNLQEGKVVHLRAKPSYGMLPVVLMFGLIGSLLMRNKFGYKLEEEPAPVGA